MKIYYKYAKLMNIDYFKKPTIKISVPETLNDPFESSPSSTIKTHIGNTVKKELGIDHHIDYIDSFMDGMNLIIERNGIISLSETPRNILMWAHYANQHEGMCIGYKRSAFEKISISEKYPEFRIAQTIPVKVNYDNCRFSDEFLAENDHKDYKEILTNHYLTKSDEWIYEKEHRCIISYASATSILIDRQKINDLESRESIHMDNHIKLLLRLGALKRTESEFKYDIHESKLTEAMVEVFRESKCATFLIDIDPSDIDSIYLGCKISKHIVNDIYQKIVDDERTKHIKIYHMKISEDRFELLKTLVDDVSSER
ncbi:DUF2971 domain-containing protein [Aeromonas dhakensis]|uniref:DUF2971 domain-containing protein n=1 Tax=Aeromonas dhakensis TaxID=196024 RepID=UPI0038CF3EA8